MDDDLDAMHAALDAAPDDQTTRRVLSDWYEEYGPQWMAGGLRWMADRDRWPRKTVGTWRPVWRWYCLPVRVPKEHAAIHRDDIGGVLLPLCPSRFAAEEALCLALAAWSAVTSPS